MKKRKNSLHLKKNSIANLNTIIISGGSANTTAPGFPQTNYDTRCDTQTCPPVTTMTNPQSLDDQCTRDFGSP